MQRKGTSRLDKINEELKREISNLINYKLHDPRITGMISVTKVKITPDLRYVKVYVSILNSSNKELDLKALKSAAGFMRSEIAKEINLRVTPEISFELDETLEYGAHIDELIRRIQK